MKKIFVIAGTEDGRNLAGFLVKQNFDVTASVVGEYAEKLLAEFPEVKVQVGKLDANELADILKKQNFEAVVDASHPYAANVSANVLEACRKIKIPAVRFEREETKISYKKVYRVSDYEAAAIKSAELGKNIYLTTGSRNLKTFVNSPAVKECNLTVRILPTSEVLKECEILGLTPKQIVAMQGPFSTDLNVELFKHANAEVIVMKNSGKIGGADTKISAAEILKLPVVLIERPKTIFENIATNFEGVLESVKSLTD